MALNRAINHGGGIALKSERTHPGETGRVRSTSAVRDQALPMILNIPVPHVGQVPFIALRPLAMMFSLGSFMLRFALHFTQ